MRTGCSEFVEKVEGVVFNLMLHEVLFYVVE